MRIDKFVISLAVLGAALPCARARAQAAPIPLPGLTLDCKYVSITSGDPTCTVTSPTKQPVTVFALETNGTDSTAMSLPAPFTVAAGVPTPFPASVATKAPSGTIHSLNLGAKTPDGQVTMMKFELVTPIPTALTCLPAIAIPNTLSTCTLTIAPAAPAPGSPLSYAYGGAGFPALVPASATALSWTVTSPPPGAAVLSAAMNGAQIATSVVSAQNLAAVACGASSLGPNASTSCKVVLTAIAPVVTTVTLVSDNPGLSVTPATVVVPINTLSAPFTATTTATVATGTATISATSNAAAPLTTTIALQGLSTPTAIDCGTTAMISGEQRTCQVTFVPKLSASTAFAVTSADPRVTATSTGSPAPAGASSATFVLKAGAISSPGTARIQLAMTGGSITIDVPLAAPRNVTALTCAPAALATGDTATCTITLVGTAAGDTPVTIAGADPALTFPDSIAVPGASTTGTFDITAGTISMSRDVTITATGGTSAQAKLHLAAPGALMAVECDATALRSAGQTHCVIALASPARASIAINVTTDTTALIAPGSVSIGQGEQVSAPFAVTAGAVDAALRATVTAAYDGVEESATISIEPATGSFPGGGGGGGGGGGSGVRPTPGGSAPAGGCSAADASDAAVPLLLFATLALLAWRRRARC
jgi:hypothetical protein